MDSQMVEFFTGVGIISVAQSMRARRSSKSGRTPKRFVSLSR